jgi:hypothetical protein
VTDRHLLSNAALSAAVVVTAFCYRFNTLGGALGGFSNDEFGYLARARQIQAGEVPFRDFNDPGWFLTDYAAAAAQSLGGYNLRSEAVLTIGMLAAGAALTFLLARRAAGSIVAALVAVAIHIALSPRHYNYPKIVLVAAGLALAWAYLDRPTTPRIAAFGALVGVAFLFRHDNLLYLGVLSLVAVALADAGTLRHRAEVAVRLGAAAAVFIAPFFVFLALNGGVVDYFRAALVYVDRDAERTSFSFPRFSIDPAKPLVTVRRASDAADIHVRWMPSTDAERRQREASYNLASGTRLEGATWSYRLEDVSPANIELLVRDPLVEDTQGLDRRNFQVPEGPLRLDTQLDTVENATAFLYYAFLLLPLVAGLAWLKLRRAAVATRVMSSTRYLVPLLVLALMLNIGLLSRGSTNIRIPDVGVTMAILLAWLMALVFGRDARLLAEGRVARALLRTAAVVVLCLTILSVNGLTGVAQSLDEAGFTRGPAALANRATVVWERLGGDPLLVPDEDGRQHGLLRVAAYLRACTAPRDTVFVLGEYPALYYFSDRRFAGGHAWLLPSYYSSDRDEALIVQRLAAARPPIVMTERRAEYDAEYRDIFEQVHRYLQEEYTEVQGVEVEDERGRPLRLLVRSDREPAGRYEPLGLPCFTDREAADAR